jgi:hypothetical protein
VTRPAWEAEQKAFRRQLWGEALDAIQTEGEAWARAEAVRLKQLREEEKSRTRNERLNTPEKRPALKLAEGSSSQA